MEVGLNKSVFSSISFDSTRLGFFFFFSVLPTPAFWEVKQF